uniref:Uncharacterized protein n=1 Tax=Ditylenchus dipsaci TaxID=166011 RepID=A0A915ESC0_9BILA
MCATISKLFCDVEPNKKKMIQDLPVDDHIKITLLLIDELTEDKNKAEIEDLTTAKNKAESELWARSRRYRCLQAPEALSKLEELIEANKIAKPEVLEALHSNKEEENVASKQADRAQHHSKVDQLVNIYIVQECWVII